MDRRYTYTTHLPYPQHPGGFGDYDNCKGHISTSTTRDRVKKGGIDEEYPCRIIWIFICLFCSQAYRFPRPLFYFVLGAIAFGVKIKRSAYFPRRSQHLVAPDSTWYVLIYFFLKVCSRLSPFSFYVHLCSSLSCAFSTHF